MFEKLKSLEMVQIYLKPSIVTKQLTRQTTSVITSENILVWQTLIPMMLLLHFTEMVLILTRKQTSVCY